MSKKVTAAAAALKSNRNTDARHGISSKQDGNGISISDTNSHSNHNSHTSRIATVITIALCIQLAIVMGIVMVMLFVKKF